MGQGLLGGGVGRQGEGRDQSEALTEDCRGGALQGLETARRVGRRVVGGEPVAAGGGAGVDVLRAVFRISCRSSA